MGNCLKTQLKEIVNNSNLDKLGYYTMYVNNPSNNVYYPTFLRQENISINSFPVGSYTKNGELLSNGKTKVEVGETTVGVPANSSLYICVPKYEFMYHGSSGYPEWNSDNSMIAMDFDDYEYLPDFIYGSTSRSINCGPTIDGKKCKGDIMNILNHLSSVNNVFAKNCAISVDINNINFISKNAKGSKYFNNNLNVKGNIEMFLSGLIQQAKQDYASEGYLTFGFSGTACTSNFGKFDFTCHIIGDGTIDLISNGIKYAVYNIETDTFTPVE